MGTPIYCTDCCRQQHAILPFHRIQQWTGEFFTPAWLRQVGVVIYLGHGGKPCPKNGGSQLGDNGPIGEDDDDDTGKVDEEEFFNGLEDIPPKPGQPDENGNTTMVIVDKSGVHHLSVNWCHCRDCPEHDMQLLAMGLFPASFKKIQTVFTFQVLDDFLLDNLECKTSALHYTSKLARVTSHAFPHTVPVGPVTFPAT
jgi:hypothetical protein